MEQRITGQSSYGRGGTISDNVYFHLLLHGSFPSFNAKWCRVELLNYEKLQYTSREGGDMTRRPRGHPRAACRWHVYGLSFRSGRYPENLVKHCSLSGHTVPPRNLGGGRQEPLTSEGKT